MDLKVAAAVLKKVHQESALAASTVAEATVIAAISKKPPNAKQTLQQSFQRVSQVAKETNEDVEALMHKTVRDEGLSQAF